MDTTTLVGTGFALLGVFVWFFCAYVAYQQAPRRGRRGWVWALMVILFTPIALFILFLLQPVHGQSAGHKSQGTSATHAAGGTGASQGAHGTTQADLYEVPNPKHNKKKHH